MVYNFETKSSRLPDDPVQVVHVHMIEPSGPPASEAEVQDGTLAEAKAALIAWRRRYGWHAELITVVCAINRLPQ